MNANELNISRSEPARAGFVIWEWFEALMGMTAVFLIAFLVPTLSGLTAVLACFMGEWNVVQLALPVFLIAGAMGLWLVRMAETAMREFRAERWAGETKTSPAAFGVWLGRQLPTIPFLARFPLTLWWLSHFFLGVLVVEFRELIARELGLPAPSGIAAILFCFAFQFAANMFLTLAIGSAQTSPEVTESVWRYRFWINGFVLVILAARVFF